MWYLYLQPFRSESQLALLSETTVEQCRLPAIEPVVDRVDVLGEEPLQAGGRQRREPVERGQLLGEEALPEKARATNVAPEAIASDSGAPTRHRACRHANLLGDLLRRAPLCRKQHNPSAAMLRIRPWRVLTSHPVSCPHRSMR